MMTNEQVRSEFLPLGETGDIQQETVVTVLAKFASAGADGSFEVLEGGRVQCEQCGSVCDGSSVSMIDLRRLEGESDPDDAVAAVVLSCPVCSCKGTLVLGYGPQSSPEDSDLLATLKDFRTDIADIPSAS